MIAHTVVFASAVAVLVTGLVGTLAVSLRRKGVAHDLSSPSLESLLRRLHGVNRDNIALVAAEQGGGPAVTKGAPGAPLETWEIYELVGGLPGLQRMSDNCDVLIELACHVQRWYPEALPVSEQLRLNAREIQWHLERLRGAERRGHLQAVFPDYAQRAVAIYYGMTQHVLQLYALSQLPGLAQLEAAL